VVSEQVQESPVKRVFLHFPAFAKAFK